MFFVERDRKPAHTVQRETALLADLQSEAALVFALELGILSPEALHSACISDSLILNPSDYVLKIHFATSFHHGAL